jgi:hypothetical protein
MFADRASRAKRQNFKCLQKENVRPGPLIGQTGQNGRILNARKWETFAWDRRSGEPGTTAGF